MTDSRLLLTDIHMNAPAPRKPRQAYAQDERRELIEKMVEQRIRSRATWAQVAVANNVPLRTAERWRTTDEWRQAESHWRRILREEARTSVAENAQEAIGVLLELMHDQAVSPFTRFNCAKTLLELAGIDEETEEVKADQNSELLEFLKERQRAPSVVATVLDIEPLDGGLLPPQLQALTALRPEDAA